MLHLEITVKRRHIYALIVAVAILIVAIPVASRAAHTFEDVPDDNIFHDDITWLKEAGVTKGCNPGEGNTKFCPGDVVDRQAMAAFLHRLAKAEVVEAKSARTADRADEADHATEADRATEADSATSADNATSAENAANADNATNADDSDLLDGLDSAAFLPGGTPPVGTTVRGGYAMGSDALTWSWDDISWGFEMPAAPTPHFLADGDPSTTECPGSNSNPQAAPGHLCVYETTGSNADVDILRPGTSLTGTDTFSAILWGRPDVGAEFYTLGTWAVTVGTPAAPLDGLGLDVIGNG